ncbi:hypothetical protein CRG98_019381 [Punica granatum]|uniref:Uncharacterized protein n=1 Tax=Punica granatum TaxID=22663 RepID=A0A2I0JWF7_PUNGR|nr:hypothetical protein CRG98_019381 [Punica granatum]
MLKKEEEATLPEVVVNCKCREEAVIFLEVVVNCKCREAARMVMVATETCKQRMVVTSLEVVVTCKRTEVEAKAMLGGDFFGGGGALLKYRGGGDSEGGEVVTMAKGVVETCKHRAVVATSFEVVANYKHMEEVEMGKVMAMVVVETYKYREVAVRVMGVEEAYRYMEEVETSQEVVATYRHRAVEVMEKGEVETYRCGGGEVETYRCREVKEMEKEVVEICKYKVVVVVVVVEMVMAMVGEEIYRYMEVVGKVKVVAVTYRYTDLVVMEKMVGENCRCMGEAGRVTMEEETCGHIEEVVLVMVVVAICKCKEVDEMSMVVVENYGYVWFTCFHREHNNYSVRNKCSIVWLNGMRNSYSDPEDLSGLRNPSRAFSVEIERHHVFDSSRFLLLLLLLLLSSLLLMLRPQVSFEASNLLIESRKGFDRFEVESLRPKPRALIQGREALTKAYVLRPMQKYTANPSKNKVHIGQAGP